MLVRSPSSFSCCAARGTASTCFHSLDRNCLGGRLLLSQLPGLGWCDDRRGPRRFLSACHLELVELAEKRPVTPTQPAEDLVAERREILWRRRCVRCTSRYKLSVLRRFLRVSTANFMFCRKRPDSPPRSGSHLPPHPLVQFEAVQFPTGTQHRHTDQPGQQGKIALEHGTPCVGGRAWHEIQRFGA